MAIGAEVEVAQPPDHVLVAPGDLIQIILHGSGQPVVDQIGEVLLEQSHDAEGRQRRHHGRALLPYVATVEDGGHDAGVGGRPADADLLHRFDQRSLRVPGRWLGGMSAGFDGRQRGRVALGHGRQVDLTVGQFGLGVVLALDIGPLEAGKLDDRARSTELDHAGNAIDGGRAGESDPCTGTGGVGHLGCDRPLPDQVVEAEFVARQRPGGFVRGPEGLSGRTDGLVGLLGVLDLLVVLAGTRGHVGNPVHGRGLGPGRRQGLVGQRGRVGPHVGDPALLVERLGHRHGPLGAEPQLSPCLLLERRSDERCPGRTPIGLVGHGRDHEGLPIQPGSQGPGLGFVQHDHLGRVGQPSRGTEVLPPGQRRPIDCHQGGGKAARHVCLGSASGLALGRDGGIDPPPIRRAEGHPFALPVDDHPGGHALDAASGAAVRFAAHDVGQLEAVDAVEDTTRLLGLDQVRVDGPALFDSPQDGLGRDLVEHHPGGVLRQIENLTEVPGDRLPFAVLIRGQVDLAGLAGQLLQLGHLGLLLG